jgi:glutamate-1-semialdehyde aminotransferase
MGAIIGRRPVMDAVKNTFISSTYWTERVGPSAALATIRKMRAEPVVDHLAAMGDRMRAGWQASAERHGLRIGVRGIPPLPRFSFQHGEDSAVLATLYTQCMLDAGFLASGAFYPSFAHRPEHVDAALSATDRAFGALKSALSAGTLRDQLRGPVASTGLRGSSS